MTRGAPLPPVAVVGCGAAASEFCLPVLARQPGARHHVVLVDRSPRQAQATAERFGFAHWCTDYASLPREVEAAFIMTPHPLHAEQACHFLSQGKHVFVEKPLGLSTAEVDRMTAAADATGVILMANHYRRLFPAYRGVRDWISSAELGRLLRIDIQDGTRFAWESVSGFYLRDLRARGVLFDRGAHTVDIVCWWLGGEPTVLSAGTDAFGGLEATAQVSLEWDSVPISLAFSRLERLENRYRLHFENGVLHGRLFDASRLHIVQEGREETRTLGKTRSYAEWGRKLVAWFLESIRGKREPVCCGKDVRPAISVIERAYQVAKPFSLPWYEDDPNLRRLARLGNTEGPRFRDGGSEARRSDGEYPRGGE